MQVSQDIVFTRLKTRFPLEFVHRDPEVGDCEIAVLFDPEEKMSQSVVVITEEDYRKLLLKNHHIEGSIFVCMCAEGAPPALPGCSTICVYTTAGEARVLNEVQRIFILFNRWESDLKSILYSDGTFWDISDATEQVLSDPYSVQDKDFEYVSYSALSEPRGLVSEFVNSHNSYPLDYVNTLMSSPEYLANRGKSEPYVRQNSLGETLDKNLFCRDKYIGRLILQRDEFDDEMFRYYSAVFKILAHYIEMLYERHNGFARNTSSFNYLKKFIMDRFDGKDELGEPLDDFIRDMGWTPGDRFTLIQMRPTPRRENEMNTKYLITEMAHLWGNCIAFEYGSRLIMLENGSSLEEEDRTTFFQSLTIFLRDHLLAAAVSRPFGDLRAAMTAYIQTEIAFKYGEHLNPMDWRHHFDGIVLDYMLDQSLGVFTAEEVCDEKVLKLKRYDEQKNTELCETLKTYLACNHNAVATAKKLCLHRTSFQNRLERIKKVADINPEGFEESLYLYLSLALITKGGSQ